MSKTAEEILIGCCTGPEATGVWSHEEAVAAMHEFAAQEIDDYKARLRKAFVAAYGHTGSAGALETIDTVK